MADINLYTLTKTGDSNTYHFRDDSKGQVNGLASLGSDGKVPSSQLPTIPAAQIQSDWSQTDSTKLDFIKNKPTLGTAAAKNVPSSGNASTSQVVMGNDTRLSDSRPASDVSAWAKAANKPTYTKSEVGLGNVDNTSDATKKTNFTGSIASGNTGFVTGGDAYTALSGKLNTSLKGTANGLAELGSDGKVPSSQLPSYVDDVLEYNSLSDFPTTGEAGKIYVAKDTNKTYRWSGTAYVEISPSLALGETSSTAYRGDRGKTAYEHSQSVHARTDATAVSSSTTNGNIKINGTETTVYTHPGSGTNPHGTTKNDVGLGNVGNFLAVSTASQTLTDTQKAQARTNIGAGTSSFSGSYNDLTNKPTIPTVNNATLTIQKNGTTVKTFTANASANVTADITVPTKVSELTNDSGYTTNTGTVTKVSTGVGLTGGDIQTTGTIKAYLKSETKSTLDSAAVGATASRQYAVHPDKSGYLSVNVPWENTWRGIQNNLTSDSTTDSLSAAQGKALANGSARDSTKLPLAGGTMTGDIIFNKTGATDLTQVQMKCGTNDYGRIAAGATASNSGYLEIATADDGAEPIYARQYSGVFATLSRTATLLDASGNTDFPKRLTSKIINNFKTGTGTVGQDKGSSANPRYFPTKWTFNFGQNPSDGDIICVKLPCAGHDYGDFISIDNGTTFKPVAIWGQGTGRLTTHYGANSYMEFVYDATGQVNDVIAVAGANARSNITGGCWRVINFYNSDNDTKVTQTATTTNANYEVLFSVTGDNTTRTEGARKNNNLLFNPSTGNLQTTQLNGVIIGSSPKFTDASVSAVGNHYTPTCSGTFSANATGASAAWSIDVVKGVTIKKDAAGHVTGVEVTSGKIPANPNTDTKVTAVGNHYTPSCSGTFSASASGGTAAWGIDVVTGVTIKKDAAGHVTGVTVASGKVPNNPDTDTKVTQNNNTTNANYRLLLSANANDTNETNISYKSTNFQANPNTGTLAVNNLSVTKKVTGKIINNYKTGTGTTAQDKGSGVSPRYFPAKWTFNFGQNPSDGDIICVKLPCAGHDFGCFISTDNGTTFKPVAVAPSGNGRLTTHYASGAYLEFIYDSTGQVDSVFAAAGADARSNVSGGCWRVINYRDTNDNIYDRNRYNCNILAWGTKIIGGNIIVASSDGKYHHLKEGSSSAGTAFDIQWPILYLSGDCNANTTTTNTYDIIHFTVTTTQSISLTAYKPVFIKGQLSGTTFTPISSTPLVQTIPTTADGFEYILLGMATSATTIYLQERHPIYAYRNSKFGEMVNDADSVNGFTVAKSVPSNAVFTDASVTAVGNHYTPTCSGTFSKSATGASASWNLDVVTGVTLQKDAKGHIIDLAVTSGKVPANPNTDTKVTSVSNHYTPTCSGTFSASATGATAAWSIDVVKGITLEKDAAGHITKLSVTSGKVPANPVPSNVVTGSGTSGYLVKWNGTNTVTNGPQLGSATNTWLRNDGQWTNPNTDTKVTQTATTTDANYEVLFSATADNTNRTEGAGKTTTLRFNPKKGSLMEGNATVASNTYAHAEGSSTTASGASAHAEGANTAASGNNGSHAEGARTVASGNSSHAEGHYGTASGRSAHVEGGYYIDSDPDRGCIASGNASHAEGVHTLAIGIGAHTCGAHTSATNNFSVAFGHMNAAMTTGGAWTNTTGTAFVIGNGVASSSPANAFSVQYNGVVKAKSTITASTTADYAEYFEWYDENTNKEDRVGYFVTFLNSNKIVKANPDAEYILGVTSGEPFVLGNGDCDVWNGMYLRDEFRRTIYEPALKYKYNPETKKDEPEYDEEGNPIYDGTRPVLNPDFDPTRQYINRADRPEWIPVGMLGVLAVRDNGECQVNSYCTVGEGGIAVPANSESINKYRVIKRNSANVVEIVFR